MTLTLRELLNRSRWRDGGLHSLEITVLHRGEPGDRRVLPGSRIVAVRASGIELTPESLEGDAVFVPYHRFLAIHGPGGAVVWAKKKEGEELGEAASGGATHEGTEVLSSLRVVLREATKDEPLVIDGRAGEGGGQILRTSLALSMFTGTPFALEHIRAGRTRPGLMRQHLACVSAAALVCGAEVEGATLGSSRLVFRPGPVVGGEHALDIGSAGSVCLVLQMLALPLALATTPSRVSARGGTHAPWAPPFPFLDEAWLPLVRRAGADVSFELRQAGFYPAGGGEVVMTTSPSGPLAPLHLGDRHGPLVVAVHAIVAGLSEEIARRELGAASELLADTPHEVASASVRSLGPGNAIWLTARDASSGVGGSGVTNVFSAIGEVGVRAEDVGRAVAEAFLAWDATGTSVDAHLADQLMLPIAMAGEGSFTCDALTMHALTNMEVIRVFTGQHLRAWDLGGSRFRVALLK
jgi:RNA 3'-terminal phosphate cyclase (ATP)